jgi:hypothetical protein
MKKILAAAGCLMVAVACMTGCGASAADDTASVFEGSWEATAIADANALAEDSSAVTALPEGSMKLDIEADGTGTLTINGSEYEFTTEAFDSDGADDAAEVKSASDGGTLGLLYHYDDGDATYYYAGDYIAVLERAE